MSDTVSLEFIGRRLDTVQNDLADVRRRMGGLSERFNSLEIRIGGIESRFNSLESRMAGIEQRLDGFADQATRTAEQTARMALLLERIARAQGIEP